MAAAAANTERQPAWRRCPSHPQRRAKSRGDDRGGGGDDRRKTREQIIEGAKALLS